MGKTFEVLLEDDLDGSPAEHQLDFSVDGQHWQIDLSDSNKAIFEERLAPFIEHARPVVRRVSAPSRTAASRAQSRAIRKWAQDAGIELSPRGRLSATVIQQYRDRKI